jgi:cation diffusion facilitator CzcD-associated flavoprotein CzcO
MLRVIRCACDIPSHAYQYSWNPNPSWSRLYAEAPEILEYLKSTVTKFGLRRYIEFNRRCIGATWDETTSEWTVTLRRSGTHDDEINVKCDVFVIAVGRLNNWKLPGIEGLDRFHGSVIHTADWPKDFDYQGKDIAVIGNGASSTQCLAALCEGEPLRLDWICS